MDVVIFAPKLNSPGKKDANYFQNQAKAFLAFCKKEFEYEGELVIFDNSLNLPGRAKQVLEALSKHDDLKVVAFCCHGWYSKKPKGVISSGIQAGFTLLNVISLAKAVAAATGGAQDVVTPFYCCSAGDGTEYVGADPNTAMGGDGGFADVYRDELCKQGVIYCRIIAHDNKGDCVYNVAVVRINGDGSPSGGQGGQWIVAPGTVCYRKAWPAWLKKSDNRFRMPFETTANIHEELGC